MLSGLSLVTLVFICIFEVWLTGACDFCLSCLGLMGDKFFSLSLILFGGRISDLCNGCWRFCTFRSSLCWSGRSYVCFCLDYNIGSLPIPNLLLIWYFEKFG